MAIYHLSCKIIGRSKGQTAVAAAAYRSGAKLMNRELGIVSDFSKKKGIVFSEITLCKNAPAAYTNREVLWNEVQKAEKSVDAQLCREIVVALPKELGLQEQITLAREFANSLVDEGMCVDWSLHDKGDGNPHMHLMATMRCIDERGNWMSKEKKVYSLDNDGNKIPIIDKKTGTQKIGARGRKMWKRESVLVNANSWNSKVYLKEIRKRWADICNKAIDEKNEEIEQNNLEVNRYAQEAMIEHIDHRSYADQGIDKIPMIHENYTSRKMERLGYTSERMEQNRQIREMNTIWSSLKNILRKNRTHNDIHYHEYQQEVMQHNERIREFSQCSRGSSGNPGYTGKDNKNGIYRDEGYLQKERISSGEPSTVRRRDQSTESTGYETGKANPSLSELIAITQGIADANSRIEQAADSILDFLFSDMGTGKKKKKHSLQFDR